MNELTKPLKYLQDDTILASSKLKALTDDNSIDAISV